MDFEFDRYQVLTFDCYGTLIDWERGILETLEPVLARAGGHVPEGVLEAYADSEATLESGEYLPYREVVTRSMAAVCNAAGIDPTEEERTRFGGSVAEWPPFDDSSEALRRLKTRFRLAAITNCDDDLFAVTARRLGVEFDWVITAQQARAYKPRPELFQLALDRIEAPADAILHVAQSLFHDHVAAGRMGLASVWIDRRHGRPGAGATPPAEAAPDLTYPDMRSFADAAV